MNLIDSYIFRLICRYLDHDNYICLTNTCKHLRELHLKNNIAIFNRVTINRFGGLSWTCNIKELTFDEVRIFIDYILRRKNDIKHIRKNMGGIFNQYKSRVKLGDIDEFKLLLDKLETFKAIKANLTQDQEYETCDDINPYQRKIIHLMGKLFQLDYSRPKVNQLVRWEKFPTCYCDEYCDCEAGMIIEKHMDNAEEMFSPNGGWQLMYPVYRHCHGKMIIHSN